MTNIEKIREMSAEEMAVFFCNQMYCNDCPFLETCNGLDINQGWLGFLTRDYEGELLY